MSSIYYYCQILIKMEVFDRFFKNTQIPNFIKIRLVGPELFHADGRKDRQTDSFANGSKYVHETDRPLNNARFVTCCVTS